MTESQYKELKEKAYRYHGLGKISKMYTRVTQRQIQKYLAETNPNNVPDSFLELLNSF